VEGETVSDDGLGRRTLADLGLTSYESRAYLALVRRDAFTAAELAAASGIPRQRVYDVLAGLVARGLVRDRGGSVSTYVAVDPDVVIEGLLAARRRQLIDTEAQARQLAREVHQSWSVGRAHTDPLDYVDVVRDVSVLGARLQQVLDSAGTRLLVFSKPPYVSDYTVGVSATRRIVEAGGDARCVYEQSVLDDGDTAAEIDAFLESGEQARVAPTLPMKLMLADGRTALFSLPDPVAGGLTSTNIAIEHPAMVALLTSAFERVWEQAEPWADALRRRKPRAQSRRKRV
jgi:hypothetical protein